MPAVPPNRNLPLVLSHRTHCDNEANGQSGSRPKSGQAFWLPLPVPGENHTRVRSPSDQSAAGLPLFSILPKQRHHSCMPNREFVPVYLSRQAMQAKIGVEEARYQGRASDGCGPCDAFTGQVNQPRTSTPPLLTPTGPRNENPSPPDPVRGGLSSEQSSLLPGLASITGFGTPPTTRGCGVAAQPVSVGSEGATRLWI